MHLNATKFIRNRKDVAKITYDRINTIMWYVVECFQILKANDKIYSKSDVKSHSTYAFEDYLKKELVDEYLVKNKHLLKTRMSSLDNVNFLCETTKEYKDLNDGKDKPDKIDIYINHLGLKDDWAVEDENLYLAVECKRINTLSDCTSYTGDIQNFCDREYKDLRIPFEGQFAFIENKKLTHKKVANEINSKLNSSSTITTLKILSGLKPNQNFDGAYLSEHSRNYGRKLPFSIFHLLLDFSDKVVA